MIEIRIYGASRPNALEARRDLDINLDCRWIKNPHNDKRLRSMTGADKPVIDQVIRDGGERLKRSLSSAVRRLDDLYEYSGKASIGVCCTSGKHRSVVIGHLLRDCLEAGGHDVKVLYYGKYRPSAE